MKLICSAGHEYDDKNISHVWWRGQRSEGGKCPECMSYDRMFGTKKCNRKLYSIDSDKGKLILQNKIK